MFPFFGILETVSLLAISDKHQSLDLMKIDSEPLPCEIVSYDALQVS